MSFQLWGCGTKAAKPTTTSFTEAITKAKALSTTQGKIEFLLIEMQGFLDAGKFNEAARTGEYILDNLDSTSMKTKRLVRKTYERNMKNMVGGN